MTGERKTPESAENRTAAGDHSVKRDRTAGTALITGASRGIGKAIAEALAADGWNLILTCSKTLPALRSFSLDLEQRFQIEVRSMLCDMGDSEQVRLLFRNIPSLDLLVNNAGVSYVGLLQNMTDEEWARIIAVNLSSAFYTSRAAIPLFLGGRSRVSSREIAGENSCPGRIINISSVWGIVGASCETAYSASKGGVNALTKALAKELAPSGIPVNAIACGCVDTAMNNQLSEIEKSSLEQEIPAGRFARPDEIASVVRQLVCAPAYLTGQIITVDGGWI